VTKTRTTLAVASIGLVVGMLGLVFLVQYPSYQRAKRDFQRREDHDRLSRALHAALKSKDGVRIDLGVVVGIRWDRMFVLAPYTSYEAAQRELPGAWYPTDHDSLQQRDDISILAFFDHDRLMERFSVARAHRDFADLAKEGGYARGEAVFSIREGRVVAYAGQQGIAPDGRSPAAPARR